MAAGTSVRRRRPALAIAPDDPKLVVAGTANGQIYVSRDGGDSWEAPGGSLPLPGYVITSLELQGSGERLWATLQGVWGGGGVALSTDAGRTFTTRSVGLPSEAVFGIARAPTTKGVIYAAMPSGVYKTVDDGAHWSHASAAFPLVENVSSLWVDPGNAATVIAGTWRRAYRSDDGGLTWRGVFDGMALDSEVFSLQHGTQGPGEIWAATCGWVYRSADRGERWDLRKVGLDDRRTLCLRVMSDGKLLAGTPGGLFSSTDGGATFHRLTTAGIVVQCIAFHPSHPSRILLGTEGGGVWTSTDGGMTFAPRNDGLTNVRVAGLVTWGAQLLVAVRHAGPLSGIYRSTDEGRTFNAETTSIPTITALRTDAGRVYAATEQGLFERHGTSWVAVPQAGSGRIVDMDASDGGLVVASDSGVRLRSGDKFQDVTLPHDTPMSAVLLRSGLWVAGQKNHYLVNGRLADPVGAPFQGGRLSRAAGGIVLAGSGGVWLRRDSLRRWQQLDPEASETLPTGDPRFPLLLIGRDTVRLVSPEGLPPQELTVPFPARDITTALLDGHRLLLGTSGYGLQSLWRRDPGTLATKQ